MYLFCSCGEFRLLLFVNTFVCESVCAVMIFFQARFYFQNFFTPLISPLLLVLFPTASYLGSFLHLHSGFRFLQSSHWPLWACRQSHSFTPPASVITCSLVPRWGARLCRAFSSSEHPLCVSHSSLGISPRLSHGHLKRA